MTDFHRSPYWMRFIRKVRPLIQAQLPLPCVNARAHRTCTGIVMPDDKWHVAHLPGLDYSITRDPHPTLQDVGASHARCNLAAGGRLGRKKQQQTKSRETRYLAW